ncbi:hypothetical protein LCGC14_1033610 [marine sediment metagenome]|uniref:Recombination endonuclease VII n=1 Tax=marine sediment metagenome TaxID=412755 RepID=A0A0F9MYG9_9ZZZZ
MDRKKYFREYQKSRYKTDSSFRRQQLVRRRKYTLNKKFGITVEQYDQMLTEQNGRCLLCNNLPDDKRRLAVDHSHTTEKVRGLLCFHCNTALGKIGDDIEWLHRASDYLKKHS